MTSLLSRFLALAGLVASGLPGLLHAQVPLPYLEEVPFITSPDNVTLEMLRVANVGAGDHLIDLGSGDGRIVILAARRFGATGLGVEIVPDLVERSLRNARDAGVSDKVDFKVQDLFKTDLKPASVITMYLLPGVNMALRPTLLTLRPGTRVVSHDWDMEDWKPDQTTEVSVPNKAVGLAKSSKIHLWIVPARVGGLWCGAGRISGWSLRLDQTFQEIRGRLSRGSLSLPFQARMQGERLEASGAARLVLQARGDTLQVEAAGGQAGLFQGFSFQRAPGASCPA